MRRVSQVLLVLLARALSSYRYVYHEAAQVGIGSRKRLADFRYIVNGSLSDHRQGSLTIRVR